MGMTQVTTLECTLCGAEYDPNRIIYTCPEHEGVKGILEVTYDYDAIDDAFDGDLGGPIASQWKYEAFLPVAADADIVTLNEGGTDLFDAPNLSAPRTSRTSMPESTARWSARPPRSLRAGPEALRRSAAASIG